jgi:MFS family permease
VLTGPAFTVIYVVRERSAPWTDSGGGVLVSRECGQIAGLPAAWLADRGSRMSLVVAGERKHTGTRARTHASRDSPVWPAGLLAWTSLTLCMRYIGAFWQLLIIRILLGLGEVSVASSSGMWANPRLTVLAVCVQSVCIFLDLRLVHQRSESNSAVSVPLWRVCR